VSPTAILKTNLLLLLLSHLLLLLLLLLLFLLLLQDRDPQIWILAADKMKTGLEKSVVVSAACQADVNPFEGDVFIHYQQQAPGERRPAQGPQKAEGRATRPAPNLPGASTRPPSSYEGIRVGQVEGRDLASFEGLPWPPARKQGDIQAPPPLPGDIKSQVSITTQTSSADGAGTQTHTENVHEFTQTGVRMLEAALRPGAWYTNSRTQPGTMASFKRASYWARGSAPA
jgi:hypothetical protein